MRTNLISPEEAAGFALAITEEMAAEQDAECDRVEAGHLSRTGEVMPPARLRGAVRNEGWLPDWVSHYLRGRATA